jgi:histidyl-tRNA synthetase
MDGSVGTLACLKLKVDGHATVVAEAEGHMGLITRLGGKNVQAFGLRGSLLLLHQVLLERALTPTTPVKRPAEVYLVPLGELAAKRSLRLFRDLVESGVTVFDFFGYAGVKNQLKAAQEAGSPIALIMGQKEAVDEVVILRDVKSGMQEVFSYDKIVDEVKKRLGR